MPSARKVTQEERWQPTRLVLSSVGDAIQPAAQSLLLAQEIPGAEFHALDTNSHVIAPSDPVFPGMMDAIDRFFAE